MYDKDMLVDILRQTLDAVKKKIIDLLSRY